MPESATEPAAVLTQALEWLEEHLDLAHAGRVEERQHRALNWEPIDRPHQSQDTVHDGQTRS